MKQEDEATTSSLSVSSVSWLRGEGFEYFVLHEQFGELTELSPAEVYRVDAKGVRSANVLLAWLAGPSIDDGTACGSG